MTDIKSEINLIKMANDIACIKQAILGNGEPGLCHRLDELEKAEKESGGIVKLSQRVINLEKAESKIGKLVGFSAGIGVCCGSVFTYVFNFFKGG